ncbi:hypothetical protein KCU94_g12, partial [Aureobasidium melanogenum]
MAKAHRRRDPHVVASTSASHLRCCCCRSANRQLLQQFWILFEESVCRGHDFAAWRFAKESTMPVSCLALSCSVVNVFHHSRQSIGDLLQAELSFSPLIRCLPSTSSTMSDHDDVIFETSEASRVDRCRRDNEEPRQALDRQDYHHPCQDNMAFAYLAVYHCSSAFTRIDMQTLASTKTPPPLYCPSTSFAMVDEARECKTSATSNSQRLHARKFYGCLRRSECDTQDAVHGSLRTDSPVMDEHIDSFVSHDGVFVAITRFVNGRESSFVLG